MKTWGIDRAGARRGPARFRPQVEQLDERLVPASFDIFGTEGPDQVTINVVLATVNVNGIVRAIPSPGGNNAFDIRTGGGADQVTIIGGATGNNKFNVKTGGGNDLVNFTGGVGINVLKVGTGGGADRVNMTEAAGAVAATVRTGDGNDVVTLIGSAVLNTQRSYNIDLGNGNNALAITDGNGPGSYLVKGGGDVDSLVITDRFRDGDLVSILAFESVGGRFV